MALTDDILTVLAPPHPAGRPFIMGGLIATLLGFGIGHWLIWLGLIFTLFCLYFFRDPERTPPARAGIFVSPADGRTYVSVVALTADQSRAMPASGATLPIYAHRKDPATIDPDY